MRTYLQVLVPLVLAAGLLAGAVNADSATRSSPAIAHGKQLYLAIGCWECHGTQGQGGSSAGPKLAPDPIPFAAFLVQLRAPRARMPIYTATVVSDADLADVYAYLRSVPKGKTLSQIPLLNKDLGK
jgi:mono/diheme cytochrome c family protein